jgi:hypothetical protein
LRRELVTKKYYRLSPERQKMNERVSFNFEILNTAVEYSDSRRNFLMEVIL